MEFGLKPYNASQLRQDLKRRSFDFVLGSVHFVDELDVYFQPYWEGKTLFQAERRYLEETLACVEAHDDFDVLGHLTYISKARANPAPRPVPYEEHRELVDEILRILAQKGKGMEINTSGVDRCGDFLPFAVYFRRFKELGGEIVTVGSDAHTASRVGQYSHRACDLLKDIFGYVCNFEGRAPIFHKL
jgi:histidinol-phosphatase (PHP family)